MDFCSRVEELSTKYNFKYPEVYDLMNYIQFRVAMREPIRFLINTKEVNKKVYETTKRYVRLQYYRNSQLENTTNSN
jgi:hypothetical protein